MLTSFHYVSCVSGLWKTESCCIERKGSWYGNWDRTCLSKGLWRWLSFPTYWKKENNKWLFAVFDIKFKSIHLTYCICKHFFYSYGIQFLTTNMDAMKKNQAPILDSDWQISVEVDTSSQITRRSGTQDWVVYRITREIFLFRLNISTWLFFSSFMMHLKEIK